MDGVDRVIRRRKSLTERLGLKVIGCCGFTWGIMPATTFHVVDDENDDVEVLSHHIHTPPETPSATTACLVVEDRSSGMNLAAALAAERHFGINYDNNEVGLMPGPNSHSSPLSPDERGSRNDVPTYLSSRPGPDSHSSPLRPDEKCLNSEINIHSSSRPDSSRSGEGTNLTPDERGPRNDVPTYLGSRPGPDSHSSPLRPDEKRLNSEVNSHSSSRPDSSRSGEGTNLTPDETGPRNDVPTYLGSRPGPDDERRLNSEAVNIHSSSSSSRFDEDISRNVVETPTRMSLMRLLEETEVYEGELLMEDECLGSDSVCCVCMRRKKGAAFIPCGHTFCRVCSRELWVNRGCCPLCNRSILEILDIY